MDKRLLLSCIATTFCVISVILELALVDFLQNTSTLYIINLQKNRNSSLEGFFKVISSGSMYISILIGYPLFYLYNYKSGILCLSITYTGLWLGNLMKNLISHPRPFWIDSEVSAMSCPLDFGAPSGHASTVGSTILFFGLFFYKKQKILSIFGCFALLVLIGIDRNYLGVHFYFQVVLGYAFAFFIASWMTFKKTWSLLKRVFKSIKHQVACQVLLFLSLFVGVLVYFTRDPQMKESWQRNYELKCSKRLVKSDSLYDPLEESSSILIVSGLFLGLFLQKPVKYPGKLYKFSCLFIFAVGLVIEQVCEMYIKKLSRPAAFFLLSLLRFIIGLYVTVFTPLVVSFCIRRCRSS